MSTIDIVTWRRGRLERTNVTLNDDAEVLPVLFAGLCPSEEPLAPDWHVGLGHELVVERNGNLYVLAPFSTCRECNHCLAGQYSWCDGVECPSLSWNGHGGLGGAVVLRDEALLVPIPETSRAHTYVLAEPAAAGVAAARSLEADRVIVIGMGIVGLGAALAASAAGRHVVVVGRHQWQRDMAADLALDFTTRAEIDDTQPTSDVVVAASGVDALEVAHAMVTSGGRLHLVGMNCNDAQWRAAVAGTYQCFRREVVTHHHYMYDLEQLHESVGLVGRHEDILQRTLDGPLLLAQLDHRFPERRLGRRTVIRCPRSRRET